MSNLFKPLRVGDYELSHRVVMAPLTRLRSLPGDIPHALNAEYYGQRASNGGLIVAEATDISEQARGYSGAPGIYSQAQIDGWKAVTMAVHAKGGLIFSQLWHTGRVSHSSLQPGGALPVAPSAIAIDGNGLDATGAEVPYETPRSLTLDEIDGIVSDFVQAARNALEAGFDGIEVHGANGYLLDQFLQDHTNRRTDEYGGATQNRIRLLLRVVDEVVRLAGAGKVGVRLSPWGKACDIRDSDAQALFIEVASALSERGLAYLHIVEPRAIWSSDTNELDGAAPDASAMLRNAFNGPIISAGGYTQQSAEAAIEQGRADAIAFGRLFIANPDLPERFRAAGDLNPHDRATFYGGGARGYTDYPTL